MFTCLLEYLDPIEDHGKGAGEHHKAVKSYFILTRAVKSEYIHFSLLIVIYDNHMKFAVTIRFILRAWRMIQITWNWPWQLETGDGCQVFAGSQELAWGVKFHYLPFSQNMVILNWSLLHIEAPNNLLTSVFVFKIISHTENKSLFKQFKNDHLVILSVSLFACFFRPNTDTKIQIQIHK